MPQLNRDELNHILERFDATDPRIQREAMEKLIQQLADLQTFKSYVHDRLDAMNVPSNPNPDRMAVTGCRIGPRLDVVAQRLAAPPE